MIEVSVIIVNWNTIDKLRDCLKSVYEQTLGIRFEVIVVDNASTDGSARIVSTEFTSAILIKNLQNRGFASASNQGIAVAQGRYVLLLNSDTVVLDNAIAKTVHYADAHPNTAVVGCQVMENEHVVQMTCFRFPSVGNLFLVVSGLAKLFKYNRIMGRERFLWWGRDSEREVDVVPGMFMLVRRKAIDKIGLLEEAFFMYSEDADWCYRFKQAGWKNVFWPGAKIIHVEGGSYSSDQNTLKMFVQKQKSTLIFLRKHGGLFDYMSGRAILFISFGFKFFIWSIIWICSKIMSMDVKNEVVKKYWLAFKFCATGAE